MASRTLNSLKSRLKMKSKLSKFKFSKSKKAQFFVLSAFAIVSVIYLMSGWMEPYTIIDVSSVVLMEESFIFNNIVEKARETVEISKDCEGLSYNLEEYKDFIEDYALRKNLMIAFDYEYDVIACESSGTAVVEFKEISLKSPKIHMNRSFTETKSF